jgi:hypothetical protein
MEVSLDMWHQWWKHNGNRELRDLVMLWWDPIGVYGVPSARDEYDSYIGKIASLLREGASEDDLVAHFAELMPRFGMDVREQRDRVAAQQILTWYRQSIKRYEPYSAMRRGV